MLQPNCHGPLDRKTFGSLMFGLVSVLPHPKDDLLIVKLNKEELYVVFVKNITW
jgi:hypothetical protein